MTLYILHVIPGLVSMDKREQRNPKFGVFCTKDSNQFWNTTVTRRAQVLTDVFRIHYVSCRFWSSSSQDPIHRNYYQGLESLQAKLATNPCHHHCHVVALHMLPLRRRIPCDDDVIKQHMVGRGTSKCYALFLASISIRYIYAYTPSLKRCSFVAGTLGVPSSGMGQKRRSRRRPRNSTALEASDAK